MNPAFAKSAGAEDLPAHTVYRPAGITHWWAFSSQTLSGWLLALESSVTVTLPEAPGCSSIRWKATRRFGGWAADGARAGGQRDVDLHPFCPRLLAAVLHRTGPADIGIIPAVTDVQLLAVGDRLGLASGPQGRS